MLAKKGQFTVPKWCTSCVSACIYIVYTLCYISNYFYIFICIYRYRSNILVGTWMTWPFRWIGPIDARSTLYSYMFICFLNLAISCCLYENVARLQNAFFPRVGVIGHDLWTGISTWSPWLESTKGFTHRKKERLNNDWIQEISNMSHWTDP